MSHDTHHGHSTENKTIISFKNAFWLVVILVGLFVAALNFVQVESKPEAEEHHGHEMMHEDAHHAAKAEAHEAAPAAEAPAATTTEEAAPATEAAHEEQPAQH
jgi:outer membrane biosynthesis protein TonB